MGGYEHLSDPPAVQITVATQRPEFQ